MQIVLTADRSQTSNFRMQTYAGFFPCLDKSYNTSLGRYILMPQSKEFLPIGLRKAESALINKGVNAKAVHSDDLEKTVNKDTKFVCFSCCDPLGIGPTSGILKLYKKDSVSILEVEFQRMINKIKKLKEKYNFKVIAGGPGVQWLMGKEDELGIDYLYFGESELTLPEIIKNEPKNRIINAKLPKEDEIAVIKNPSCFGAAEITRGCGRGCKFCSPTSSGKIRNISIENIKKEIEVNIKAGLNKASLRSEDFLLYKSKELIPQVDEVMNLFKEVYSVRGVKEANPIHSSFASVLANPDLIDKLDVFLRGKGKKGFGFQPGIETGSERLIRKYMLGKKYPFKEDWGYIVKEALKIIEKKGWVTTSTVIFGMPGETEDDLIATENLIDEIKDYSTLVVPQLFVTYSSSQMKDEKPTKVDYLRLRLINKCFRMDFKKAIELNNKFNKAPSLRDTVQYCLAKATMPKLTRIMDKKENELKNSI